MKKTWPKKEGKTQQDSGSFGTTAVKTYCHSLQMLSCFNTVAPILAGSVSRSVMTLKTVLPAVPYFSKPLPVTPKSPDKPDE